MRKLFIAAALLAAPALSSADDSTYGALMGSAVINDPSRDLDEGYGAHALFGWKLNSKVALEPNIFYHNSDVDVPGPTPPGFPESVDSYGLGLDVNVLGNGLPFYLAGIGARRDNHNFVSPALGHEELLYVNAGIGMTVPQLSQGRARLRAEARWIGVFDDQTVPGDRFHNDFRINIGFMFGGASAVAMVDGDADGDGVTDSRDQCPNSTVGATVDGRGCEAKAVVAEKDTDGDGVVDSSDECPGTAKGLTVDGRGCVALESFVLKGVSFDTGSDVLKAGAKSILDSAVSALKKVPEGEAVEIGGHTDSVGNPASNQKLSQRRAESVRAYLISKGVKSEGLTAKGYGADKPIADNKTAKGRADNRRVEFKVGE